MAQGTYFAQLLFRCFQLLLDFFELGEAFLDILIELVLDLLRDLQQLGVDAITD